MKKSKNLKDKSKKLNTLDWPLLGMAAFLILFTVAILIIFWHTGSEPSTLVASVFTACTVEGGCCTWIWTRKRKEKEKNECTGVHGTLTDMLDSDEFGSRSIEEAVQDSEVS